MTNNDWVAVLDLGTAKTACLAARLDERDRLEVLSLAYVPTKGVKRGVVVDLEDATEGVENVVGKIERHLEVSVSQLFLNVSGSHLESVLNPGIVHIHPPGREIRRQDVHEVVKHSRQVMMPPDREQVLAAPSSYRLDGETGILDPLGLSGTRLEVTTHIVTGLASQIQNVEKTVTGTGRKVTGIAPTSYVSGLGVVSDERIERGCVVVDIGAGKTDVGVFAEGTLVYQEVLKLGADHVTNDIAQLLKVDFEEAERLKVDHGAAIVALVEEGDAVEVRQMDSPVARPMHRRVLVEIIESRMNEIVHHVNQLLQKSSLVRPAQKTVLITGGGSLLPGTDQLFAENMPEWTVKLAQPKVSGRFAKQVASPMLATSVGLARYALLSQEPDLAPVSQLTSWKDKISTIRSLFGGKS